MSKPASNGAASTVNRKKQKRRQKQAAKLAAEQDLAPNSTHVHRDALNGQQSADRLDELQDGDDFYDSEEEAQYNSLQHVNSKLNKKGNTLANQQRIMPPPTSTSFNPPPPPPPPAPEQQLQPGKRKPDRIWNTSTQEERERIKEFWLSLEEVERRSLVKVEKEAVLKKMKEQQKHSCSCQVCGRKRTAIEEELEVLYDAYYEELEQYANHQQLDHDGMPILPPTGIFPTGISKMAHPRITHGMGHTHPHASQIHENFEDEEDLEEEEYSDEEEEEGYSDEEPEEIPRGPAADFFNFGNSLTVQGGILTVADDLLKNDGKKFIEMMEQLAERRMQREEEAQYAASYRHHAAPPPHNHGPPLEDDEYDDEDDEDYDSQDEEDYDDEDEMETMTEEQRMEEGRRMFQIFAARMFEQRVLTAYREKVARDRQEKLLEELADEKNLDAQREAKRAKEAAKKKEKKRLQKLAKDEEKARKEKQRLEEEAAAKGLEEQRLEEQRQKKEEQRKKREAEKKAQEEERLRKEAEKQKKLQEAREHQAELDRKQREQKDREKKKKEEVRKKEREEREAKEKEAKERKEKEQAERKEKEAKAKADREVMEAERRKEEAATEVSKQVTQIAPTPIPIPPLLRKTTSTAIPLTPALQPQQIASGHASPHPQIATPIITKAPVPVRPRQASFQDSHHSSPKGPGSLLGSSSTSPSSVQPLSQGSLLGSISVKIPHAANSSHQSTVPGHALGSPPGLPIPSHAAIPTSPTYPGHTFPNMHHGPFMPPPGMPPRTGYGPDPGLYAGQLPYGIPQYRNYGAPNGMPFPPGINTMRPGPQQTIASPSPGVIGTAASNQYPAIASTMPSHSRNPSASFDKAAFADHHPIAQPISRPNPIKRPSSPPRHYDHNPSPPKSDVEELSKQLGSSALLDDDEPVSATENPGRQNNHATGPPRSGRIGFGASPMFQDPLASAKLDNYSRGMPPGPGNTWASPPYTNPHIPGLSSWSNAPGSGWPINNTFGVIGGAGRANSHSRAITLRLLFIQAYRQLMMVGNQGGNANGFIDLNQIMHQAEKMKPPHEPPMTAAEVDAILSNIHGDDVPQSVGGIFHKLSHKGSTLVKFEAMSTSSAGGGGGGPSFPTRGPGDLLGSPLPGHAFPSFGGVGGAVGSGPRGYNPAASGIASPNGFP
ncbi:Stress response protein nst1 [Agyrium rufum]|nr:Stress response protein nst1 [Agyrium rufum]